jgi:hypothetical protein
MKKPNLWLGVALGCVGVSLAGCENMPKRGQQSSTHSAAPVSESDSDPTPPQAKGFFKSTRLPGSMSSEGADIEKSLGVQ